MSELSAWTYSAACALSLGLAAWQSLRAERVHRPLLIALLGTGAWAACLAIVSMTSPLATVADGVRSLAWLSFIYATIHQAEVSKPQPAVRTVYAAVAWVVGLEILLAGAAYLLVSTDASLDLNMLQSSLGLISSAGLLILLHNLYGQASSSSRKRLELPIIALAAIWAYDLHFHTVSFLTGQSDSTLFAMRGGLAALLVPLFFSLAGMKGADWRIQLSRSATFQSFSAIVVLLYLIFMMAVTRLVDPAATAGWHRTIQIVIISGLAVAGLLTFTSPRVRAWFRVTISKHFFEHRYDYRSDWLRFTRAIAQAGDDAKPLSERVAKALADIAGSPAALLLSHQDLRLIPAGHWNWGDRVQPSGSSPAELVELLESQGHVLDLGPSSNTASILPAWLAGSGAWAGIPLLHNDRLTGIVLLDHPTPRRAMDWEDYDLFRTAGMQAASYIAEAQSQEALASAQKFDEFNRRFAFIMHDIKNLVSQLSLVTRNAERHADNPEFRADMIATLQSSVRKMNDLLARLSRSNSGEASPARNILLQPLLARIVEAKRRTHPLELGGDARLLIKADPIRLEQAVAQLVQNAIDASPAGMPVRIEMTNERNEVRITIEDRGFGMSADFIRTRLFQPFASTKEAGFGIGAFEAKSLIEAMAGRIEVTSREGDGSLFSIFLPAGQANDTAEPERLPA